MKRLVLTGFSGDAFAELAERTVPLFIRYASKHGAAFECRDLSGPRPPSWMKVCAAYNALETYDVVLWLDVDVVVVNSGESIFDELAGAAQAIVEHHTECGDVPNCGVWAMTKEMRDWLRDAWNSDCDANHPWWEQAAVLRLMGYSVSGTSSRLECPSRLYERTAFLPPRWNHHPRDSRKVRPEEANFVHVTQYADRAAAVVAYSETAS